MIAITIAIARHLVQNRTRLGGGLVSGNLRRSNHPLVGKLLLRENGGQRSAGLGRRGMERRNLSGLVHELCMRHTGSKKNCKDTQKVLHIPVILLQNKSH